MTLLTSPPLALLLRITLLLTLALLAVRLLHRRGPAVQTLAGRAALAAVTLLLLTAPLTKFVPPLWHVPTAAAPRPAAPVVTLAPTPLPPIEIGSEAASSERAGTSPDPTFTAPNPSFRKDPAKQGGRSPAPPSGPLLLLIWATGTALLLLWLGVCQWHLTRLHRRAVPLTGGLAFDILAALTPHPPRLLACPGLPGPFLAGVVRPAIYLPADHAETFSPDALRAVLAHELAHTERHDTRWTLASRLLCALLWPQPLLWLLCRRLEQLAEDVCDRAVLAHACPPRVYADCLLSLAERRPLSRRTSPLTAGLVPFRSQLARRIVRVLSASSLLPAPPTRVLRMSIAFCAVLGVFATVILVNVGAEVNMPHFIWAKQQGWVVRPVQVIDLDHPGFIRVSSLPYKIGDEDKVALNQLNPGGDVVRMGPMANQTKAKAEAVLATHPRFFYAEYLLSQWYRQHGDTARADALFSQSLHDAPVVLAGRYEYDDGAPLAGFHFSTVIFCYDPNHLSGKNSESRRIGTALAYSDVVTDGDGCFYLPVFQAIYSQDGVAWSPDGLNQLTATRLKAPTTFISPEPSLSGTTSDEKSTRLNKGFIANSRVAVMPPTKIRSRIVLSAPFNKATGSERKPIPVSGPSLRISWKPYPSADHYVVTVNEYHVSEASAQWSQIQATSGNRSKLGLPLTQRDITLNFVGSDPIFNRMLAYSVSVSAMDRQGKLVSNSGDYFFRPINSLFPHPLTKTALAQVLGPGFQVVSIKAQGKSVIAEIISPPDFRLTSEASDALNNSGETFGFGFMGWNSKLGLSMDQDNKARSIQIVYRRKWF